MSNTEYSRPDILRVTTVERQILGRTVMREIMWCNDEDVLVPVGFTRSSYLLALRSLLERLSD